MMLYQPRCYRSRLDRFLARDVSGRRPSLRSLPTLKDFLPRGLVYSRFSARSGQGSVARGRVASSESPGAVRSELAGLALGPGNPGRAERVSARTHGRQDESTLLRIGNENRT